MTVAVVVAAAGRGERLGTGVVKALRELAGEPLVLHAVRGVRSVAAVGPVVVTAPVGLVNDLTVLLAPYDVVVTAGGKERQESVRHGLAALPAGVDHVLVHDAARALTPPSVFTDVIAALRAGAEAVVPVLPLADTVKRVIGDRVTGTVERGDLRAVQTPQGFAFELLVRAHAQAGPPATDDAALVERLGRTVHTVPGSEEGFKVTRSIDLVLAAAVLRGRAG
ncbi:MAG: 2-C-methyl-D-erythritol 4-phosphate cytidylyltransferase [Actinomycetota bacterium]|nr:2-C-methyl-D-erythritol 4-phosphate cytidylyltransferase [Actinomycetota bacterium]